VTAKLLAGFRYRLGLAEQDARRPQLVHDLFSVVSFLRHGSGLLNGCFITFDLDQEFQAK